MKKSGCAAAASSIFSSKSAMPFDQASDELHDHFHHRTLGLDHRPIPNGRNGLANRQDAALDELLIATVVLAKERPQLRRGNFLQLLQRRPALQQRAHQFRVQVLKPVQHLREVDLQVARQTIGCARLLIHQLASFLHQILYSAGRFRVRRQTAQLVAMLQQQIQ